MITTQVERITPDVAHALLATNAINRPVSPNRVIGFVNAMKAGQWQLNGETIIVSDTGKLLDGQHRLYAVIEHGGAIEMNVARGAPMPSFSTIDLGTARSARDILTMDGVSYAAAIVPAAAMLWRMWHGLRIGEPCTPQTIRETIPLFPALRKWAAHADGTKGILPRTIMLTSVAYLEDIAADPEAAERFFADMTKGANLHEGSPTLALRNRLTNIRLSGQTLTTTFAWPTVARVLSAVESAETLMKLPIVKSAGATPTPKLWGMHVAALPANRRLPPLPTGAHKQLSPEQRKMFHATVVATREGASA